MKETGGTSDARYLIERKMLIYQLSGSGKVISLPEDRMIRLLDSVNNLQTRYKDLINMINQDPELKKIIERKILENNLKKNNL